MVYSPGKTMMGFQWNPKDLEDAKAAMEKKSSSLETFNTPPIKQETERITGQPAGMAGIKELSLRQPKQQETPLFYQPPVDDKKVRYIPPTQEKPLPGHKAPIMVPMEGNPNIPKNYQDLPTPPPPPDWTPPARPATNEAMYKAPPAPPTKKGNQVQLGMQPPVLPKNE